MVGKTCENVYNRFKDWLRNNNLNANVTDYAYDLINRATEHLWFRSPNPPSLTMKRATLSISDNQATLPSDCESILEIFADTNSDGQPDRYYYENAIETWDGYWVDASSFDVSTGHSVTLNFYNPADSELTLVYQFAPPVVSDTAHYLFFPEELVFKFGKMMHLSDKGAPPNIYQVAKDEAMDEWSNYISNRANKNIKLAHDVKDSWGNKLYSQSTNLRGTGNLQGPSWPYKNSYHRTGGY